MEKSTEKSTTTRNGTRDSVRNARVSPKRTLTLRRSVVGAGQQQHRIGDRLGTAAAQLLGAMQHLIKSHKRIFETDFHGGATTPDGQKGLHLCARRGVGLIRRIRHEGTVVRASVAVEVTPYDWCARRARRHARPWPLGSARQQMLPTVNTELLLTYDNITVTLTNVNML